MSFLLTALVLNEKKTGGAAPFLQIAVVLNIQGLKAVASILSKMDECHGDFIVKEAEDPSVTLRLPIFTEEQWDEWLTDSKVQSCTSWNVRYVHTRVR